MRQLEQLAKSIEIYADDAWIVNAPHLAGLISDFAEQAAQDENMNWRRKKLVAETRGNIQRIGQSARGSKLVVTAVQGALNSLKRQQELNLV